VWRAFVRCFRKLGWRNIRSTPLRRGWKQTQI